MIIESELKYTAKIENDNDKVQILKRKFSDKAITNKGCKG